MGYTLGVDLGTTYTAAAIRRGDRLEVADLGTRAAAMPSVVYLRDDGAVLTGEAALRRGVTDPGRMSREFKRRMGDTTAILLGGVPWSVDGLMARVLQSVVAAVTERQGEPPEAIAVAHPANWGPYKKDLLEQAVRRADLDHVSLVTEPEAAAIHYATLERLEPGATVAVYDLGGGTFDVAVLRKTEGGFELLGEPEGIERLGGIDFDEAVFRHVVSALRGALDELDPDDPVAQAAVSRLREECVAAKEALSADTEVSVPVLLPNVQTEVRLTRAELEAMIRPALGDTLVVLRRTLRSAGVDPAALHSVLLVGGSSRIPLIAQMVGADLGRPVALDVHPKHSVAMGAAILADQPVTAPAPPAPAAVPAPPVAVAAAPIAAPRPVDPPPVEPPLVDIAVSDPTPTGIVAAVAVPASNGHTDAPPAAAAAPLPPPGPVEPPAPPQAPTGSGGPGARRSRPLVLGAAAVGAVLIAGAAFAFWPSGDDEAAGATSTTEADTATASDTGVAAVVTTTPATTPATSPVTSPLTTPQSTLPTTTLPTTTAPTTTAAPPDPCGAAGTEPCIVIDQLRVTDTGAVEVTWSPRNFTPDVEEGFHAHLFWNTGTAAQASTDAADRVGWDAVETTVHTSAEVLVMSNRPPAATAVCATVGIAPAHTAYNPALFHCLDLPDGSI